MRGARRATLLCVALNHRKAQFAIFVTISSDHSASNVSRVDKKKDDSGSGGCDRLDVRSL
jgi:hypothetical protein